MKNNRITPLSFKLLQVPRCKLNIFNNITVCLSWTYEISENILNILKHSTCFSSTSRRSWRPTFKQEHNKTIYIIKTNIRKTCVKWECNYPLVKLRREWWPKEGQSKSNVKVAYELKMPQDRYRVGSFTICRTWPCTDVLFIPSDLHTSTAVSFMCRGQSLCCKKKR